MSYEFLDALETKIRETGERLSELREENSGLRDRLAALERELESLRAASPAAWERERDQLRKRVEKLAGRLSSLLEA